MASISTTLLILLVSSLVFALPDTDLLSPPGMVNETVYSGYLNTDILTRKIHYVFVAARNQPQTAPLTIWFNGGPGCSSLIGMLQEIGPYLVGNKYTQGDSLTRNPFSWNEVSNLLFLQSPAIVGFSTDKDRQFQYTDDQTGNDAFAAIKYFLRDKAPQFKERDLYLSGQSYAGKYVPDVAVRILVNNQGDISNYIHLKGIVVGNGVMNFKDDQIDKSEIEYLFEHDFIDDRLWSIYKESCKKDFNSPRCRYFQYQIQLDSQRLNPYNVYEVCRDIHMSQRLRMLDAVRKFSRLGKNKKQPLEFSETHSNKSSEDLGQIPQCPNDLGAISYWNTNKYHYHVDAVGKVWAPCNNLKYTISQEGSMKQYAQIFLNNGVRVWLFNGDWDDVVPYRDTEMSLEALKISKTGEWEPWFSGDNHAGFFQKYDKLTVITVKGASHMVPATQPKAAYQLFYNFIKNRPVNTPV